MKLPSQNGGLTETVLWTNSSPTSNWTGTGVTVPDISGYDYIKFEFRVSTSVSDTFAFMCTSEDLRNADNTHNSLMPCVGGIGSVSGVFIRRIICNSDTNLTVDTAYQLNTTANNNSVGIPTRIIGIK